MPEMRRYELLSWLSMEGKNYDGAYDAARMVDRLGNKQGAALLDFAGRAYTAGAFDVAVRAFREAIDVPLPLARRPAAQYGLACALEADGLRSDSIRGPFVEHVPGEAMVPALDRAIGAFREVIAGYPRTEYSAKAWYRIGSLQADRFFNLDAALSSLERAAEELSGITVVRQQILLKVGQVFTMKGDTVRAAEQFRSVATTPTATPDQTDEANFRLAELEYFGGKFDSASEHLSAISLNLKADYANDALQLQAFLTENAATPPAALREYARADFLARRRQYSEAIALYRSVAQSSPRAALADDALLAAADLLARSGLFTDAITGYEQVLTLYKEGGTLLDRAQFRIGEVCQYGLRDDARAIAAYESLLAGFPKSLLADEARKRIRSLRKETL
jgi:tetratricopeptide (TPR) repeat protein